MEQLSGSFRGLDSMGMYMMGALSTIGKHKTKGMTTCPLIPATICC